MSWIPIEDAILIKDKTINFIELNKSKWIFPATQTIHIGWLENKKEFYSENSDRFIKKDKVTHIFEIPCVPEL